MGHRTSFRFFPSCEAFSASFILFENSSRVSSRSSNPSGGGFRFLAERTAGMSSIAGSQMTVTHRSCESSAKPGHRVSCGISLWTVVKSLNMSRHWVLQGCCYIHRGCWSLARFDKDKLRRGHPPPPRKQSRSGLHNPFFAFTSHAIMVINATYLAQTTRTCKNWPLSGIVLQSPLMTCSPKLGRSEKQSPPCLPTMAAICS